ncbi:MAG: Gfo/Idh/MocA family oxidoreductase [Verrucomicrobiota bacterium JB023]|nr:Gfo/Idh/MocA family oxidoreductase [Verrucomicrobiota bacterium JB023]
MSKTTSFTRRSALKGLAAWATVQVVPSHILRAETAPSNQLTKAILGCGGISDLHLSMPGKLLALCDVDRKHLDGKLAKAKAEGLGQPDGYRDFREVIARDDVDIIHIATPPHWHALMAIEAAKAGKDIWCEKPMSRTIGEGLKMVEAVEKHDRIFRLNTWFRFRSKFYGMNTEVKRIKKAVMHGLLGDGPYKVTLNASTGFDWKFYWVGRSDLDEQPVPEHLDYDLWLGPAPMKPYHPHRTHQTFRGYWDYDGGGLGDMGQHYLDPVQYILGKDDEFPVSVEIDADKQDDDAVGTWRRITYTYEDGTTITLDGEDKDKDAAFIEGSKGKIMKGFQTVPAEIAGKVDELPDPPEQVTDFHEAVRERKKFALNEANGFHSATLVNLGIIAHRLNENLRFDGQTMKFDSEAANALIHQPMRGNWSLES